MFFCSLTLVFSKGFLRFFKVFLVDLMFFF